MANITRIKASDTRKRHDLDDVAEAEVVTKVKAATKAEAEVVNKVKAATKAEADAATKPKKATKAEVEADAATKPKKAGKKHKTPKFIRVITKPFRAFGRYLRDSWGELRQVRWPSRKATWKLTLAVIVYCGILIAIIMGLDLLFTELFGWILG